MNPDVMKSANGKWMSILLSLGFSEKSVSGKHSPCPMCKGKDRFRMMETGGGGRWICNQCGSGDAMNLVMLALNMDFKAAADKVRPLVSGASYSEAPKKPNTAQMKRRLKGLMDMWRGSKDRETVKNYLMRRGLPAKSFAEADLRGGLINHYSAEGNNNGQFPAMIARIMTPQGKTVCLHRTYVFENTTEKKITKTVSTWSGGAIRLFKAKDEKTLIVAEGIETALAARWLYYDKTGEVLPAWATVSANGMKKLAVPENIKKVLIFADNDASYTGHLAAYDLANRLVVRDKKQAEVYLPKHAGQDWLDVWTLFQEKNG